MDRFKMIASSYLVLVVDGNILLSRRFHTGYEDGNYSLPAGHVEDGESLTSGLLREVREEIGVTISPDACNLVHVMHRKSNDIRMDFFFAVDIGGQKPVNKEPEKCDDLQWFPLAKLPPNVIDYIRHAVGCYEKKIFYSEFGW